MKIIAKKSLGQNFLVNKGVLAKVLAATELKPQDMVLEIGPGKGVLTEKLAQAAGNVIAVEKDHRLIEPLKEKFSASGNVEIIEADILKFSPSAYGLGPGAYKIVANIPYYITSHLLRTIFEKWPRPELIVLMVQKEVAQRMTARPPDMNLLALSVQLFAQAKVVATVSRGSFSPAPSVDSAIVRLTPHPDVSVEENREILKLASVGFSAKRKQLIGTLARGLHVERTELLVILSDTGIRPDARPETLTLPQWKELSLILDTSGRK